MSKKC